MSPLRVLGLSDQGLVTWQDEGLSCALRTEEHLNDLRSKGHPLHRPRRTSRKLLIEVTEFNSQKFRSFATPPPPISFLITLTSEPIASFKRLLWNSEMVLVPEGLWEHPPRRKGTRRRAKNPGPPAHLRFSQQLRAVAPRPACTAPRGAAATDFQVGAPHFTVEVVDSSYAFYICGRENS